MNDVTKIHYEFAFFTVDLLVSADRRVLVDRIYVRAGIYLADVRYKRGS